MPAVVAVLALDGVYPVVGFIMTPTLTPGLIGPQHSADSSEVFWQVLIVKGQRVVAALISKVGKAQLQPVRLGAADGGMGVAEDLLLCPVVLPGILRAEPRPQGRHSLTKGPALWRVQYQIASDISIITFQGPYYPPYFPYHP